MRYVILGSSAAGVNAGRELRARDNEAEIIMISKDSEIYSRCILHHYLGNTRTVEQLNFAEADYFQQFRVAFMGGMEAVGVNVENKAVLVSDISSGEEMEMVEEVAYDKLLIATGSSSFVPPIENLNIASNVVGFRNLEDIVKIKDAMPRKHVVILGSGLVGLDAIAGLEEIGVKPTIVEMAPYPLTRQLDPKAARAYIDALNEVGVKQYYSTGIKKAIMENGEITALELSCGETIPCDFLIVSAGVRANVKFLEGSGIEVSKFGLVFDAQGRTNVADIYGAGDVSGLRPIWPVAVKEGIIAAANMAGGKMEMTDFFASKSTMNFFGVSTMSLGDVNLSDPSYEISIEEDGKNYKKIIHKDGKIYAAILQGDLSYSGVLQQLIINKIDVRHVRKPIFKVDYSDFFNIDDNFEFFYTED
ncbi:MAG: FAD-dependent oxidoreductase [Eubacteriales bacterium]